ncbi:hypothetical protein EDD16DRAFT_1666373 [Pisolithus croceorrhizus]|nr:hypothetical protein EDD16DRAFT_1666373 [Pisolithus croceorrhizus]
MTFVLSWLLDAPVSSTPSNASSSASQLFFIFSWQTGFERKKSSLARSTSDWATMVFVPANKSTSLNRLEVPVCWKMLN